MTFDFTEIQYEGKTVAQAEADWTAQLRLLRPMPPAPRSSFGRSTITAPRRGTPRYSGAASPYTTQMFTDFIAQASADNYEFVTLEELACPDRCAAEGDDQLHDVGNTITATVTPDPTAPDLGEMALDVINGGTDVIQNVANWYAYNAQELFLPSEWRHVHDQSRPDAGRCHAHRLAADAGRSALGHGRRPQPELFHGGRGSRDHRSRGARDRTPVVTGATISSLVGDQLDLDVHRAGRARCYSRLSALRRPIVSKSLFRLTPERPPPISSPMRRRRPSPAH